MFHGPKKVETTTLHQKHMKPVKPFTPYVIASSIRNGFYQSICRRKDHKTKLQCLTRAMPRNAIRSWKVRSV